MAKHVGSKAVVLGGSVAGLLAARTLADQFERVEILERDLLPTDTGVRKGVPQGRQTSRASRQRTPGAGRAVPWHS